MSRKRRATPTARIIPTSPVTIRKMGTTHPADRTPNVSSTAIAAATNPQAIQTNRSLVTSSSAPEPAQPSELVI